MSHWSFAASLMVILAGIGVVALAAWLGWGNWQRNGRRGKIALLEGAHFDFIVLNTLQAGIYQVWYVRVHFSEHARRHLLAKPRDLASGQAPGVCGEAGVRERPVINRNAPALKMNSEYIRACFGVR